MSTFTFSFLLVISSIGYSCQDEVTSPPSTLLHTILKSSTPTHSTLPSVPYTSQSSTERAVSTLPQSRLESTSMDMSTEYYTTVKYTSTPENNASVTFSTTSSYRPSSTSLIPDTTNDITSDATEAFTSLIPDTTKDITTDATEAFTSLIPDTTKDITTNATEAFTSSIPGTTTDITTNETEASTSGESTTSPQNTDHSTKFQPTSTILSIIPGPVEEQRYYFLIPVCILLILIILIIFGVYYFKYRPSILTRRSSMTKLDLGGLRKQEPIVMSDLKDSVTGLHKDDNLLFSLHYECLSKTAPLHSCSQAEKDKNQIKNRFINVLPFDHSRVILPVIDEDSNSDYINANFLPGFNSSREYIATQGPLPGTINDFWRMIWEYDVTIIVMLTSCKESGRPKCEQYWPIEFGEEMVCGDIKIKNTSSSTINTYTCSVLHLTTDSQSEVRVVKHFHYLTWKDMTASIERHDILEFISTIRQNITPQQDGPIVVHCSAGVGRTGTFIVLDYIMQYIQTHDLKNTLDIYGFIMKLRGYRVLIVQSESQYVFIYDCAVDLIEEKRKRLSEILNGHVKEGGESNVAICEDKQRTTSL